ncbi:putative DNA binding domain-containing protein [Lactovum odontotermitis]
MILDESDVIEYKSSKTSLSKSLFESISSFANTKGGIIFLGVGEKMDTKGKKHYPVEGIDNPQRQEEILSQQLTDPNVLSYNSVESFVIQGTPSGKSFIKISVAEAPDNKKPVLVRIKDSKVMVPFIRVGSSDKIAKDEELKSLIRHQSDELDVDVLCNYSVDDLDKTSINDYRRRVEANPKFEHYQSFSLTEFLEKIGVIATDRKSGQVGITAGGLLFFGKSFPLLQNFPHFQMDLFDRRSDERWRNRISTFNDDLNVYQFFVRSYDYLQSIPENPFILDEKQARIEVGDLLKVALREALLNVVMHSDYFSEEHEVIDVFWDYFDFSNAGTMKIPIENFFTTNDSKTRNPVISKLLKLMGFGELAGTGGEQIFHAAQKANFKLPSIESDSEKTVLRIWAIDFVAAADLDEHEAVILRLLTKETLPISRKEIIEKTDLSVYYVREALNSLMNKGYIETLGNKRSTQYRIKQSLEQQIATIKQLASDLKFKNY